jgi:hypothetical protein
MARDPDQSDPYRQWTRVIVTLVVAGCVVGIAVPAGLGWDFANFYDAGRRVAAGQIADLYNPDSEIGGRPPQGTTGFFGTPLSALFYLPLSAFSAETALVLFKIQNVLAFGVAFAALFAFYRPFVTGDRLAQSRFAALFAFLVLIFQPFWTIFRVGGQTTPTVLLLIAVGLIAHTRRHFWGSAICIVLAALIKPALAPAVLFLACVSGIAFLWRLAGALAAAGLLSLLLMGWPIHAAFLDLMARSSGLTYAWYFNSSIYILIDSLRVHAGAAAASGALHGLFVGLTYALKGAVVLTMARLVLRSRRAAWTPAARRHFDFTLTVVFFLMWSPTVWEHYLSLLFPLLVYVVAAREYFSRTALAIVAAIFLMSVGQNLIFVNWLRYGFAFDTVPELVAITLFKSAPLLLTMILLWRHSGELFRSHAAPAWERQPVRGRLSA